MVDAFSGGPIQCGQGGQAVALKDAVSGGGGDAGEGRQPYGPTHRSQLIRITDFSTPVGVRRGEWASGGARLERSRSPAQLLALFSDEPDLKA